MEELSRGLKGTPAAGVTMFACVRSASKYEAGAVGLLCALCKLSGEMGGSVPADEAAEVDIVDQNANNGRRCCGVRRVVPLIAGQHVVPGGIHSPALPGQGAIKA